MDFKTRTDACPRTLLPLAKDAAFGAEYFLGVAPVHLVETAT